MSPVMYGCASVEGVGNTHMEGRFVPRGSHLTLLRRAAESA